MDIDPVAAGSLSFMGLAEINRTSRDGVRHSGSTRSGCSIRVGGRGGYCSTSEPLSHGLTLGLGGRGDRLRFIVCDTDAERPSEWRISTHPATRPRVVRRSHNVNAMTDLRQRGSDAPERWLFFRLPQLP